MKKLFFFLLTFALLGAAVSCTKTNNEQVLVRFHSELDADLTNLVMRFDDTNQTTVGFIPAGQTTDYIAFDYFQVGEIGGAWPMGLLEGTIYDDVAFTASSGLWCGTGVDFKQLEPGQYTLNITKVNDEFYQILFE